MSTALVIFLAAGALAVVVSVSIATLALKHIRIPTNFQFAARVVIVLTGINIAVSLVSGVFGGIVAALQRMELSNTIEITSAVCRAIAIIIVLIHGKSLIALAIIQLSFTTLSGAVYALVASRLYPQFRIDFRECDKESLKLISSFSIYSFIIQFSTFLIFSTDSIVISIFLPVSAVTFFVIAGNLISYSRSLLSGMTTAATPMASFLEAKGHTEELNRVLLKGTRYATMLFLPIGISFLLRGSSFVGLWMGRSYAVLSGEVLCLLTVGLLFSAGNGVAGSMALGIGKHKGIVPVVLAEGLINLALSIMFIRHYGIAGVAVGTVIPNLIVNLVFWPLYIRHIYRIGVRRYAFSTWVRPGLAALPFALCTYAVQEWWPASNLMMFFLQVTCTLPVIAIPFWFFCLTAAERQNYFQGLRMSLLRNPARA